VWVQPAGGSTAGLIVQPASGTAFFARTGR